MIVKPRTTNTNPILDPLSLIEKPVTTGKRMMTARMIVNALIIGSRANYVYMGPHKPHIGVICRHNTPQIKSQNINNYNKFQTCRYYLAV